MKRCLIFAAMLSAASAIAQNQPDMGSIMQAMGAMMGGGTNAAAVVDFRELKALLPAELPNMKRTSATGEKNSTMGMTIATAEGRYEGPNGEDVTIKITDMGGTGAIGGFMQYGWASMEVDKETDTGYERSTTISGHKAMEKYDNQSKNGEVQVLVNKHFIVEISGYSVTDQQLKDAVSKIDLTKLAGLQPKAVTPAP